MPDTTDLAAHEIEQTAANTGLEAMIKIRNVAIVCAYFMCIGLYHSLMVLSTLRAMIADRPDDFIL